MRDILPLLHRFAVSLLLLATAVSCTTDATTGPGGRKPPYLAVIIAVDAPPEITSRGPYSLRVRELSGTLPIDTTIRASSSDTVIISVTAATYRVDISDVPPTCGVRDGTAQAIVVPPNSNTSLVRFFLTCAPTLVVAAYTDGVRPDSDFVLTVKGTQGAEIATVVAANDTVRIPGLAAGRYDVTLRHISTNCVVTSDGGEEVSTTITASGGAFVPFRIVCSEVARRPRIVKLVASYSAGSVAYAIHAIDPDKDIERTFFDVTDCRRKSVLVGGGRRRGGFSGAPNVTLQDSAVIVGAYDLDVPDAALSGRCIAMWVADERGNTSDWVELPLVPRVASRSPVAPLLNARLNGTQSIRVDGAISDPNGDYLGMFVVYLTRDGVVSLPPDGQPDRLVAQPAGLIGVVVPEFPLGIGLGAWNDYLGTVIYLVDRAGNFTRIVDMELFR